VRTDRQKGFTLVEVMVAVGIIGVLAALGIPRLRQWMDDNQVREAASSVANAFHLARTEAMRSGQSRIVFIGQDIGLNDLNGGTGPEQVAILDAGPPGSLDCAIDPGDTPLRIALPPDVDFTTAEAGAQAPADPGTGAMPITFTQPPPVAPGTAASWVLFRPDGVPVGLTAGCVAGRVGTGGGGVYLSNGRVDYSVALAPLGGVRVSAWDRGTGAWN